MSRNQVNLKTLPIWLQYSISLSVAGSVVAVAWLIGRNQPVSTWITTNLIPALGWLYIFLFVYVVVNRLFQKK